jgi:hypothetical protein
MLLLTTDSIAIAGVLVFSVFILSLLHSLLPHPADILAIADKTTDSIAIAGVLVYSAVIPLITSILFSSGTNVY